MTRDKKLKHGKNSELSAPPKHANISKIMVTVYF